MVFVHARKETVKSGMTLHEMAQKEGNADDFLCVEEPGWDKFRHELSRSKNKEMKELFTYGIGIHHAGMLRSDRTLTEQMFERGCLKVSLSSFASIPRCWRLLSKLQVLCCTATLAWGVNLPAHAGEPLPLSRASFHLLNISP